MYIHTRILSIHETLLEIICKVKVRTVSKCQQFIALLWNSE